MSSFSDFVGTGKSLVLEHDTLLNFANEQIDAGGAWENSSAERLVEREAQEAMAETESPTAKEKSIKNEQNLLNK